MSYFAHETAVVDDGARIGEGTKVSHFSHVSAGCEIGRDCSLGQNVFVASLCICRAIRDGAPSASGSISGMA